MKINAIYTTFMGEQSAYGIGAPVHFLRAQGCHLRCYLPTLGVLCDTPEGLTREGGTEMSAAEIIAALNRLRTVSGGVNLVCFSGGDPLWRTPESLNEVFHALAASGYNVVVESSGTLSIKAYRHWAHVDWVLDYKAPSAGVKNADNVLLDVPLLTKRDYLKFVLHDEADYLDFVPKMDRLVALNNVAKIVVGVFWGGPLSTFKLVEWLVRDSLLGRVSVNMQAHKALLQSLDTVDAKLT